MNKQPYSIAGEPCSRKLPQGVHPVTSNPDYDEEQLDFLKAIQEYKKMYRRPFPAWTEVLLILKSLGYRRIAETTKMSEIHDASKLE